MKPMRKAGSRSTILPLATGTSRAMTLGNVDTASARSSSETNSPVAR